METMRELLELLEAKKPPPIDSTERDRRRSEPFPRERLAKVEAAIRAMTEAFGRGPVEAQDAQDLVQDIEWECGIVLKALKRSLWGN
ncbi:MAG: hypothetical protein WC683_01955 [bacterium]